MVKYINKASNNGKKLSLINVNIENISILLNINSLNLLINLIDNSFRINRKDENGKSILISAIENSNEDETKFLLDQRTYVNISIPYFNNNINL
ncbi:hypothetical protein H8356DRAFT_1322221 [Neocallimastix lanati (nom. inval.)]|nr:hypothetical protein H8356DRAFT_1322221 [Neocallimastix sp. JGI-2020a]